MRGNFVLIDNDPESLEWLEGVVKATVPEARCYSFIFSDEALDILSGEPAMIPDYIFIEVHLNRVSGRECLARIRTIPKLNASKVIMMSSVMPAAVGEAFKKTGASDYFQKPLLQSDFRHLIETIVGDHSPALTEQRRSA